VPPYLISPLVAGTEPVHPLDAGAGVHDEDITVRKTGGANATQAAHAPWRDPRQTETTDGPFSPSAPFHGSYLTILRHLAAY